MHSDSMLHQMKMRHETPGPLRDGPIIDLLLKQKRRNKIVMHILRAISCERI